MDAGSGLAFIGIPPKIAKQLIRMDNNPPESVPMGLKITQAAILAKNFFERHQRVYSWPD
jgi:hypothetical protein